MKLAVIADVHGNSAALEAVLADIEAAGVTEAVNLGDHVSGPLDPGGTADLLMARGFPSIRGNHDRALVEGGDAMVASDHFAAAHLRDSHRQWLAELPTTMRYQTDVFMCHGTPRSDVTNWLDRLTGEAIMAPARIADVEQEAEGIAAPLLLCGHTHIARVVRLRDGRIAVNPGSVGCPAYRDMTPVEHVVEAGTPHASYALMERKAGVWQAAIRYVAYDHMRMADLAAKNGRPDWAKALATGWMR
jgi:predicted phosphodiesterase